LDGCEGRRERNEETAIGWRRRPTRGSSVGGMAREKRKRDRAWCGGRAKGWRGAEGEKKNIGSERSPGTFRQINSGTH